MRLGIFKMLTWVLLGLPLMAWGQRKDTVLVREPRFQADAFPVPGTAFNSAKYAFDVRAAAARGAVLAFPDGRVGKVSGRVLVMAKEGEVLGSGIEAKGTGASKALLKALRKAYGPPFSLQVHEKQEVVEWRPNEDQPCRVRYTTTTDGQWTKVWIWR